MSEEAILQGVRDAIRTKCGYSAGQCDVELDEFPPAMVGEVYVTVQPQLWTGTGSNETSGGTLDEMFGCRVSVILRAMQVPKDRTRTLLLNNLGGLNHRLRKIIAAIHFQYDVMNMINGYITDSSEKLIKPLVFGGCDARPRVVNADSFSSGQGPAAGFVRAVIFGKARRIQYQSKQV